MSDTNVNNQNEVRQPDQSRREQVEQSKGQPGKASTSNSTDVERGADAKHNFSPPPWEEFPGKASEDDLDETDRGYFTQEEVRNSIHRF